MTIRPIGANKRIRSADDRAMVGIVAGPAILGTSDEAVLRMVQDCAPWYDIRRIEASDPDPRTESYWIDVFPVTCEGFAAFLNDIRADAVSVGGGTGAVSAGVLLAVDAARWVVETGRPDATHGVGVEWTGGRWRPTENAGDLPITLVTWSGANAYAHHVGARLPREKEWERAARGEHGYVYPWGDEYEAGKANLADYWLGQEVRSQHAWDTLFYQDGRGPAWLASRPTSEGTFPGGTSPFGCEDMVGNVAEWCADAYDATPEGSTGEFRVMRGAGRYGYTAIARAATRRRRDPESVSENLGFRCATDGPL